MRNMQELSYEEHQSRASTFRRVALGGLATSGAGVFVFTAGSIENIHNSAQTLSTSTELIAGGGIVAGLAIGVLGIIRSISHSVFHREDYPTSR